MQACCKNCSNFANFAIFSLTLDGTDHNTLDEVFLKERINKSDGKYGEDHGSHTNRNRFDGLESVHRAVGRHLFVQLLQCLGRVDHLGHDGLEGDEAVGTGVDNGIHVSIPLSNTVEEGDGCKDGHGGRDDDLKEDLQVAGTIDESSLFQRAGDGIVVGHDEDGIIYAEQAGDDVNEEVINEAQSLNVQVYRNHTAAEVHGEGEDQHVDFTAHDPALAQTISDNAGEEDVSNGTDDGTGNRNAKTGEGTLVGEDELEVLKGPLTGPEEQRSYGSVKAFVEGDDDAVPERIKGYKSDNQHEDNVANVKDLLTARCMQRYRVSCALFVCHNQNNPFPVSLFESAFVPSIMEAETMERRNEIAVE